MGRDYRTNVRLLTGDQLFKKRTFLLRHQRDRDIDLLAAVS
jgi:hypothetical protein